MSWFVCFGQPSPFPLDLSCGSFYIPVMKPQCPTRMSTNVPTITNANGSTAGSGQSISISLSPVAVGEDKLVSRRAHQSQRRQALSWQNTVALTQ